MISPPFPKEHFVPSAISRHLDFLYQWMKNPRQTASVVPSSAFLAEAMVRAVREHTPAPDPSVLELGPGNGAITKVLLKHFDPSKVLAMDLNQNFVKELQIRFPDLSVISGDAQNLKPLMHENNFHPSVIVSSLGFLAMPQEVSRNIVRSCCAVLPKNGILVQYTYGKSSPLSEGVLRENGLECLHFGRVLRNIPPASVFVYKKH